ncbi:Programmed cell death protein 5 [Halotydeus destructor]|nr:Programmed cell death protein 5 [Halotydeus destructor]
MEEDDELAQIRARRMAELQQQQAAKGGRPGPGQGNQQQNAEMQREKEEEMKNSILSQILSQEARTRLNILKAAKPEKAKMVENILVQNARRGAFSGKLSEEDLKDVLEKVSSQMDRKTTITYDRRRAGLDSDSD